MEHAKDKAFASANGEWKIRVNGKVLPHTFNSKGAALAGIGVEKKRMARTIASSAQAY